MITPTLLCAVLGVAFEDSPVRVDLSPCKAERPPLVRGLGSLLKLMSGTNENLVARGSIEVEGESFDLYLPEAKTYRVDPGKFKPGSDDDPATILSIDADGNGQLEVEESWYASLPLRIGDRMFEVRSIAADRSHVVLRPSDAPLAGLIRGRSCPPFSLITQEGRRLKNTDFAGKVLILDVWSVT